MQENLGEAPTLAGNPASTVPPGTWVLDPDRSTIEFVARHFVVSKVRGHFVNVQGTVVVPVDIMEARVEAWAESGSVETGDPARDDHLRSADFFDSERYPSLYLVGGVVALTGRGYQVRVQMTIRDVTRTVDFDVLVGEVFTGGDGFPRLTATGYAVVNRKDFGLRWNATIETGGVVVADQVELALEFELMRTGPA
jgi:polyisoprenoid-binding protein YceI